MIDETTSTTTEVTTPPAAAADLEAELAALEAAREKRAKHATTSPDVTRRKIEAEKAIAAAELEHGPVGVMLGVVRLPDHGVVIVKRPNAMFARRFVDAGKTTSEAFDQLVRPVVVYPTKEQYDAKVEEFGALPISAGDIVLKLAGFRMKELEGK